MTNSLNRPTSSTSADFPRRPLLMPNVEHQVANHGDLMTAAIRLDDSAVNEVALELWEESTQVDGDTRLPAEFLHAADRLTVDSVTRDCCVAIKAKMQMDDNGDIARELKETEQLLQQIESGTVNRSTQDVTQIVSSLTRQREIDVRTALPLALAANPRRAGQACADLSERLSVPRSPADANPAREQLYRFVKIAKHMGGSSAEVLPTDAQHEVFARLNEQGQEVADRAIFEVVQAIVQRQLHNRPLQLELRAAVKRSDQTEVNSSQVTGWLKHRHQLAVERNHQHRSHTSILLPGPAKEDILTSLLTHYVCADRLTLIAKLRARVLQDADNVVHDDTTEEVRVGARWLEAVYDGAHRAETLLSAIGRRNVEALIGELRSKTSPTVYLAGLDHERFNLNPLTICILRIPKAVVTSDAASYQDLVTEVERQIPGCRIVETDPLLGEVRMTRVRVGWIVGIEQSNLALLNAYAATAKAGHPPHLTEIVPDSVSGFASPQVLALAQQHTEYRDRTAPQGAQSLESDQDSAD